MHPYSIIKKKQNNIEHSEKEIQYMIDSFTSGKLPEYQMSAWLMAIFFQGMSLNETLLYTKSLKQSGITMDFSNLSGYVIDKHSTGGVGDKVSLILGPILAACGCYVPMISGRGLGHTGGTIDKLESIPGYLVNLPIVKFQNIVESIGLSIISQTDEICPADGKIYSLRDVTGTIESMPLICGSILSKKLAEGIEGLIMDIKWGNGAFMKNLKDAHKLGDLLNSIGDKFNLKIKTCYTGMFQPLGKYSGLWCEIKESINALSGKGPKDLMEVVNYLGNAALIMANIPKPYEKISEVISNGKALEVFTSMVALHSGDVDSIFNTKINLPKYTKSIISKQSGTISKIQTKQVGIGLIELGAGRIKKGDNIDYTAGIEFNAKLGEEVKSGDVILNVFCSNSQKLENSISILEKTIQITDQPVKIPPIIQEGELK